MTLMVCKDCTAAYSVGAPRCPQCGSKKSAEQGAKGDPTLVAASSAPVEEDPNAEDL